MFVRYFNTRIRPHLDNRQIEYVGLLPKEELARVYRKAAGLLFLISWCEPFGLVGTEAQASGTPVIATRYGALPANIVDGETGFLVDTIAEAVQAVEKLGTISPAACRRNVEARFSDRVMTQGYENVYRSLVNSAESA